jgi:DNA-binding MarR family transcriptional regulator
MTRWLNEREDRAWRGYRGMRTQLDLLIARDLNVDSRLSEADYDVLSALSETKGHQLRLSELADELQWTSSRLSHQIGRMEARGLVRREGSPADARGAVVQLGPMGLLQIQLAAPNHVESVRRHLFDALTPAQIDALADITQAVLRHLGPWNQRRIRSRD